MVGENNVIQETTLAGNGKGLQETETATCLQAGAAVDDWSPCQPSASSHQLLSSAQQSSASNYCTVTMVTARCMNYLC